MESEIDFGELSSDENLKERITDFRNNLENTSNMLESFFSKFEYDELVVEDKVRYDLFVAFAIDSLYWMYLRTKGIDPNQHDIKFQINRIKEYMNKSKQIYDKKTIMPRINQKVAERFIRNGLWEPDDSKSDSSSRESGTKKTLKRKRENETN